MSTTGPSRSALAMRLWCFERYSGCRSCGVPRGGGSGLALFSNGRVFSPFLFFPLLSSICSSSLFATLFAPLLSFTLAKNPKKSGIPKVRYVFVYEQGCNPILLASFEQGCNPILLVSFAVPYNILYEGVSGTLPRSSNANAATLVWLGYGSAP